MGWPGDRERRVATSHFWVSQGHCQKKRGRQKLFFCNHNPGPQPRAASPEREQEGKILRTQGPCDSVVSVSAFSLEGSARWNPKAAEAPLSPQKVCFHQDIGVKQCFRFPSIDFEWTGSSASMCEKYNFSDPENLFFCKARFHPTRGLRTKRGPQRGIATFQFPSHTTHKTSRIKCLFKIWQSYPRVPQILKVQCAWYSWKYVARIGSEPLKLLYSLFLYNTQAVVSWRHVERLQYKHVCHFSATI